MKQDIHDWKHEHLHAEGYRMKCAISDTFTGFISFMMFGIKLHIHHYTVINVPAKANPGPGMNPATFAYTPTLMCRCGHKLAKGHNEINEWWEGTRQFDNDVNSLYSQQAFGRALRTTLRDGIKNNEMYILKSRHNKGKSKISKFNKKNESIKAS